MAVTPTDVATTLGRPAPDGDSSDFLQWAMWIQDTERLIAGRLDVTSIDSELLDYVVREVVAERARFWTIDGSTSQTVAVDDGSVTKRWENGNTSRSLEAILADWWDQLTGDADTDAWTINPLGPPRRVTW